MTVTDDTTTETPEAEPTTTDEASPKPNREARYRTERNAARDELAAATARIERMQRAEVERFAAEAGLSMGADLFINGNGVADYLTDQGDVDAERVAADVAAVLAERPGLRRNAPAIDPSMGLGGQGTPQRLPTMADLLRGSTTQPY
ncbi:hypothetical protein MMAD_21640 [Mycolicibacterium madagascariense]|uniref:Uncharacterized protein n=1 Tax=Mycolicibacterium madagascariense TaxID=212765 RepID=A0A7I7XFA1_9MYCO|nr:hypothetical protein [Mycolicibacterium madagascariense]MCV7015563.1 hypothetical protein [Mycolicibacterium madagascariense]BBZ27869.1 hypothetical protein MMAD_21640 [Mycolicibacterium madagascariense]